MRDFPKQKRVAGNVVHGHRTPVRYQGLAELDEHWPLIRRLLFDYVRDAPITRTDKDDFIIFNEEHERTNLRHLLDDIRRNWIEPYVIRYNIVDRFRSGVLLLYVRVLKNDFSNDVLLFRRQFDAQCGGYGRWRIWLCRYIFADNHGYECRGSGQKTRTAQSKSHIDARVFKYPMCYAAGGISS